MKQFYLTILSILCLTVTLGQTSLPNSDFEIWEGSEEHPENEQADPYLNFNICATIIIGEQTSSNCSLPVTKTTDANSGNYAAKLETISDGEGGLNSGAILVVSESFGGVPFTGSPKSISAYVKYSPVGGDVAKFSFTLSTDEELNDVVGTGELTISNEISTYTKVDIPITYIPGKGNPQYIFITIVNNDNDTDHLGTTLYVDDITYNYDITGLNEFDESGIVISPIPAKETILFSENVNQVTIIDAIGTTHITATSASLLNISSLERGFYFVSFNKGGKTYTKKILVD